MKILDYFLPNRCLVCNYDSSASLCGLCYPELHNYKLDRCQKCFKLWDLFDPIGICERCQLDSSIITSRRHLWPYNAVTRDFISTLKYRPSRALCRIAGIILANEIINLFPVINWDYKLGVPSDRKMLLKRGFNQVDQIISRLPGENISSRIKHLGYESPQAKLKMESRHKNIQNVFKFQGRIEGGKILLVDDMVTTGATAESLAKTLRLAGAQDIYLLSLSSKY